LVEKISNPKKITERLKFLLQIDYSIHFHVWDEYTFLNFLMSSQIYLNMSFEMVHFVKNDKEIISILRKI
jgi:hypothetical protein